MADWRDDLFSGSVSPIAAASATILLERVGRVPGVETVPKPLKRAVHFRVRGIEPYGFILNTSDILWYFRAPGLRAGLFSREDLATRFPPKPKDTDRDLSRLEPVFRIETPTEADAVAEFAISHL